MNTPSIRCDVVVANRARIECLIDNFSKLHGFDPGCDRVLVFDCTEGEEWRHEYAKMQDFIAKSFDGAQKSFLWYRRRSRVLSHGAHLDYLRLLMRGDLSTPCFSLLMQDHYLDTERFVKEDSIPENCVLELAAVEECFEKYPDLGCAYRTRNGIRVSMATSESRLPLYGDVEQGLPGARERCVFVDGTNCFVRPHFYLNWLEKNGDIAFRGDGSYGDAFAWEVRFGSILYEQSALWCDLGHNLVFSDIDELREQERQNGVVLSRAWYDHWDWMACYGADLPMSPHTGFPVRMWRRIRRMIAPAAQLFAPAAQWPSLVGDTEGEWIEGRDGT